MKQLTLVIICQANQVLLGMKKRGFGAGRWNGFGGKVELGETIVEAAARELLEEANIVANNLEDSGILNFKFADATPDLQVHVFRVTEFSGEPLETEEMRPQWFKFEDIPYERMWADDIFWLPLLIKGEKFKGEFVFDKPSTAEYAAKIISQKLEVIK
ncbi:MAG TPA: 8-oxo-dGTP diphosphatase [Candidatus Saccharimonadales bacterium]|nr:8-oxo-dGTP diphosphatase [Candidatus Saccharimonadales bacterium]